MVSVTDRAKEELKRTIETRNIANGKCLRLAMPPVWEGEGDFGIVIDEAVAEDCPVCFHEITVLLVSPGLAEQLINAESDFKDSDGNPRFTLDVF